ncbi:unnamed protein product, partial [Iphiclides podalirius]
MPYRRRFSAKMPDYDDEVTVVDVYDLASDIGKECEIIIEKYGPDAVTPLLPKVINALELLENLAVRNEKENQALHELTAKISQLENDKIEKAEYRQRFEKELEAIEEQWRTESAELVTAVARLQDENKRLRRTINAPADGTSAPPSPAREHDQEVLSRLSSTAEKQRATLRHQELQLQEKQQLIESLTNQVDKLAQVSRDLRRKQKQLQNQIRLVCEERSELTAIVQSQQRDIAALQQSDAQNKKCTSCGAGIPEVVDDEDQSSKPTFSVRELRAILHERNELKLKLNRAEEQLQALQIETQPDSTSSDTSPSVSTTVKEDDEAPVQGPLPAEPDDAPWKRNSGIRKLFWLAMTSRDSGARTPPPRISFGPCLISPWALSPGRSHRSARRPRPVAPPPPPRRHSDPTARTNTPANKFRRYSEVKRPKPELDLRQELSLNLNTGEVDNWLGTRFEEIHEDAQEEDGRELQDYRFNHDIPLQRSISLDGGIEIFKYLSTLSSDWSDATSSSSWTLNSNESDGRALELYRSFEDVPASPAKLRSRRASYAMWNESKSTALHVLKSYKGVETQSGGLSPEVRKLRKTFSFKSFFDEAKDTDKSLDEGLEVHTDDEPGLEMRMPLASSVSFGSIDMEDGERKEETFKPMRQRRTGTTQNVWYEEARKFSTDLRKKVLMKRCTSQVQFKSAEDLAEYGLNTRSGSAENIVKSNKVIFKDVNEDYSEGIRSIRTLQRSLSSRSCLDSNKLTVPTIIVTDMDTIENKDECIAPGFKENVAKLLVDENVASSETTIDNTESVEVEVEDFCNCRICTESDMDDKDNRPLLRNRLGKLFLRFVSLVGFGKKLTYWDENNNVNEGEMYNCIMHVLKLMFGLWLRHLDHNPPVLSQGYGTVS